LPDRAQTYPSKPVRVIVPYAPGGALDSVARLFSLRMAARLGATFVVKNKPGANTIIGSEAAAKAQADGHTIFFAGAPLALNTALGIKESYDVLKDFAPVMLISSTPVIITVNPATPYRTLADIVAASKADPKGLSFATAGTGSMPHLVGEALRLQSGANLTHVGYKGSSAALQDAIGGAVPLFSSPTRRPVCRWRRATARRRRGIVHPAAAAAGHPDHGRAGIPRHLGGGFPGPARAGRDAARHHRKLHEVATAVSHEPEVRERLAQQSYNILASTPEELTTHLRREINRWTPVVKAAGIKL